MNMLDDILLQKEKLNAEGFYRIELFISSTGISELKRLVSRHFGFGDKTSLYGMEVHKSEYEYSYIEGTTFNTRHRIVLTLSQFQLSWSNLISLEKESFASILRT